MAFMYQPGFGPPMPTTYMMPGPFTGTGFPPFGMPPQEPPRVFYGRDPTIHGNTVYKYKKISGDGGPPMNGMPPALFAQAQQSMAAQSFGNPAFGAQPFGAPPFGTGMAACPLAQQNCAAGIPPVCNNAPQSQGDNCIVKYFEDNVVNLYKPIDKLIFEVPLHKHKICQKILPLNTRIKDVIQDIECSKRANWYLEYPEEYPKEYIGIQELERRGGRQFEIRGKIMLKDTTKKAKRSIADVFGSDRKEILLVRFPVCK